MEHYWVAWTVCCSAVLLVSKMVVVLALKMADELAVKTVVTSGVSMVAS